MNSSVLKTVIASFFLLLGKVTFDIFLFADFFQKHNTAPELFHFFGIASIAGIVVVVLFNYMQRALPYGYAIFFSFTLLFIVLGGSYVIYSFDYLHNLEIYIASCSLSVNLLVVLLIRGLLLRISQTSIKLYEKYINSGSNSGILLSGLLFLIFSPYLNFPAGNLYIHYFAAGSIFLSGLVIISLLFTDKNAAKILDNLQEIKVRQRFYKLITKKYFVTILISTALAAFILVFVYGYFIKVNVLRYKSTTEFINLIAITATIFSGVSIAFELFFKERLIYSFGLKINIILMPIIVLVFCLIFAINILFIGIAPENEFYFFVSIFAILYLIFTQFSLVNVYQHVINTLYLPLDSQKQNDFYIKSSFLGFILGIGLASLSIKHIVPKFPLTAENSFIIINIIAVLLLMMLNRFVLYVNYKKALHKRLEAEEHKKKSNDSFVQNIVKRIDDFSQIQIIRIINLMYIINPSWSKNHFENLAVSENSFIQRTGLISAIKLYLLKIFDKMLEISQSKYFPSAPNRDKVEQLINRFNEVKNKMQKDNYIHQLSISKRNTERVYGAMLANYAPKEQQDDILSRLIKDPVLPVAKNAIISAAGTQKREIIKSIITKLDIPELSNAAYTSLLGLSDDLTDILEDAFYETGQSEKVQIRIVRLMGDIASEKTVEYLLKKLNYTNQNIISAALKALSKCNLELPEKKAVIIKEELHEVCKYIVWNTAFLIELEKQFVSEALIKALQVEIDYNYKSLFNLLALLYNPSSIQLIQENLWSGHFEKETFALELASVVLKDEIKPVILPLIRPLSKEEKVRKMQTIFVTEKMDLPDILHDIIQRDYKWINPWTKACAIMEISKQSSEDDLPILLANMVNPDPMIAELAGLSVFGIDQSAYFENKEIFKFEHIISKYAIEAIEKSNSKTKEQMPALKFEIIKYLQNTEEFKSIPGEILKQLTDDVSTCAYNTNETIETIDNLDISSYHYLIYEGEIELKINGKRARLFKKGTFVSTLDLLTDYQANIELKSVSEAKLYKFDPSGLADKLSFYDEIPFSIVENTPTEKLTAYETILKNEKYYKG